MITLRTLKKNYQIPLTLFTDILEIIETGLYYNIKEQKLYEYTVENSSIEDYMIDYTTLAKFTKNFITYLKINHLTQYTEFSDYVDVLCEMYEFYQT